MLSINVITNKYTINAITSINICLKAYNNKYSTGRYCNDNVLTNSHYSNDHNGLSKKVKILNYF